MWDSYVYSLLNTLSLLDFIIEYLFKNMQFLCKETKKEWANSLFDGDADRMWLLHQFLGGLFG